MCAVVYHIRILSIQPLDGLPLGAEPAPLAQPLLKVPLK
jgi:hypothetical protein